MAEAISQEVLARAIEIRRAADAQAAADRQVAEEAALAEARRNAPRGLLGTGQDVGVQLLQGAVGLGQAAYGLGNLATLGTLDRATGFSDNFRRTNEILQGFKTEQTQAANQRSQQTFDEQGILAGVGNAITDPLVLQDLLISNAPSLIPAGAAGRAAGTAAAEYATARGLGEAAARQLVTERAERAVLRTAAGQSAGQTSVDAINQARQAGATENELQAAGIGAGLIAGVATPLIGRLTGAARLEGAAANALPGGAGAAGAFGNRGIAAGIAGGAAREATEEYAQSAAEQLAQNIVTPNQPLWDGVGQQAALGALAGGFLGGGAGGLVALRSPRTETGLRATIRNMLTRENAQQGDPLGASPLTDPVVPGALEPNPLTAGPNVTDTGPLPVEEIDLGRVPVPDESNVESIDLATTPLPGEPLPLPQVEELSAPVEEIAGAPAPRRSLFDITGRQPTVAPSGLPTIDVEELPPAQRTGLFGAVDAQRGRGRVGGTDLFAGPLDAMGAFPAAAPAATTAETAPAPKAQQSLDFNAAPRTWKQRLSKELGLKPNSFRGAAWDQFVAAADAAGVQADAAGSDAFLQQVAPIVAADPATAPLFAARLHERYAPAQTPDTAPAATSGIEQYMAEQVQRADAQEAPAIRKAAQLAGVSASAMGDYVRSGRVASGSPASMAAAFKPAFDAHTEELNQAYRQQEPALRAEAARQIASGEAQGVDLQEALELVGTQRNDTKNVAPATSANDPMSIATTELQRAVAERERLAQANEVPELLVPSPPPPELPGTPPVPIGIDATIARQAMLDPTASPQQHAADAYMDLLADAPNPDILDETFIALKHHPAWETMSDEQRTEIAEEFEMRYARITGEGGKFNRIPGADPAKAMKINEFQQAVANANAARAPGQPQIIPLEDASAFETATGQAATQDAAGVFLTDRVYMIRQNIATQKDFTLTLAHELGHHGLSVLLGDRMPAVLNRLWTNPASRQAIKAKMRVLAQTDNAADGSLRRLAAEEVLADMVASGAKINGDVLTKVRSAIDGFAARALGYSDLKLSNADVDKLLRDVGAVVAGRSPADIAEPGKYPLQGLEDIRNQMLTGEPNNPKFSQAKNRLNETTTAGEGSRDTINDTAKLAVDGTVAALADTQSKLKNGTREVLLDFTPLNWLARYNEGKFVAGDGHDALKTIDKLSVQKEGRYADLLSHDHDLKFGDEKFRTSPQALAKDWHNYNLRHGGGENLSRMMNTATLYKVWPQKSWADQSKVNYEREGFTELRRQQAYEDVRKLWDQVGAEGQTIFKKSQAIAEFQYNSYFASLSKEYAETSGHAIGTPEHTAGVGGLIDAALQRIKTGPYSSLQRSGDYLVTVRDGDGDTVFFGGYDTQAAAETAAAKLRKERFTDASNAINVALRSEFNYESVGLDRTVTDRLRGLVDVMLAGDENSKARNQLSGALVDLYMQSLPDRAYLNHAKSRRGTEGYGVDALRSFSDYSLKSASRTSSLQYDGQIRRELQTMNRIVREAGRAGDSNTVSLGAVLRATTRQVEASKQQPTSAIPTWLARAAFFKYMTSPSQLFVNALQTFNVTMPSLAGEYGGGKTLAELNRALGAFAKSGGNLVGEKSVLDPRSTEARVLQHLQQTNQLDASFAYDLVSVAAGDAQKLYGLAGTSMRGLSWFMHSSEKFNRQVTALMTARLEAERAGVRGQATEEQVQRIADKALDAIRTTHGDYSSSNAPPALQGPWRRAFFQFQKYRINMLAMLGKEIRDAMPSSSVPLEQRQQARRTLAWLLGTQLAFTGAAGSILAPVVFMIADAFRDDDDLLDSRSEFLRQYPQWLTQGLVSSAFQIDLGRVGMNTLLPIVGDSAYAPNTDKGKDTATYYLMQNLGPWTGLVVDAVDGVTKAMQGDSIGAMKGLAPKPLADVYRATLEGTKGVRDARGVVYDEPGVWGTVTTLAGLRSVDRREAENLRGASYEASTNANTAKQRYLSRLALGHATGDQDLVTEAMANIQQWNQAHPDMAIRASEVKRAVINRSRAQLNANEYGIPSARPPGQSLKDALAL